MSAKRNTSDVAGADSSKRSRYTLLCRDRRILPLRSEVPTLALLASKVLANHLVISTIPSAAEAVVADRREKLLQQLKELDKEKESLMSEMRTTLGDQRNRALEHMSVSVRGGMMRYCNDCDIFFCFADHKLDKCSALDCTLHKRCPKCKKCTKEDEVGEESNSAMLSGESKGSITCWQENNIATDPNLTHDNTGAAGLTHKDPPISGFTKCWICKKPFCNTDFERHYGKCRANASLHCGFRPPTDMNCSKGYLCVPGHCGKLLNEDDRYFCGNNSELCDTVCCKECRSKCQTVCAESAHGPPDPGEVLPYGKVCGNTKCKECTARDMCFDGACFYWEEGAAAPAGY